MAQTNVNVTTPHMYDHPERGLPANDTNALGRALVAGKVPENAQINNALEAAKMTLGGQSLPHYGQRTADDIRTLLEDMQMLLESKNKDEVLQHFLTHVKQAGEQAKIEAEKAKIEAQAAANQHPGAQAQAQAKKQQVKHQARGVAESLKTVVLALGNSKDFRALLLAVVELLQVTASQQNPNGLLDKIIDPLRRDVESDSDRPLKETLTDVKNQAAHQAGVNQNTQHGGQQYAQQQVLPGQAGYVEVPPQYTGANTFATEGGVGQIGQPTGFIVGGSLPASIPRQSHVPEHNVHQYSIHEQNFKTKKPQTPQQKEKTREILRRFNALWTKASREPALKQAIESILEIFDDLKGSLLSATNIAQQHAANSSVNPQALSPYKDAIWRDVRDIIAQWTGRYELDQFISDARDLALLISHDQALTQAMYDAREYAEESLQNPDLLQQEHHQNRAADVFHELAGAMEKWVYNSETDYVLEEASDLINSIINDDMSLRIRYDVEQMTRNLVYNDNNEVDFRVTQEILESMRQIVLPVIMQQVSGVPLPRIEGTDEAHKTDFAIDNLLFPGGQLYPEAVKFTAKEKISMDSRISAKNRVFAKVKLDARRFDAHLENVNFMFHKHGALGLRDNGLMDVKVGGENARITVTWLVLAGNKTTPGVHFQVENVYVHLDQVHIKIKEARHDVLLPLATKLFAGTIKTRIEAAIKDKITLYVNKFDQQLNNVAGRAITQAKRFSNQRSTRMRAQLEAKANQVKHRAEERADQSLSQPSGPHQVDLVSTKNRVASNVQSLTERAKHQARKAQHEMQKNQQQPAGQLQYAQPQYGQQQQYGQYAQQYPTGAEYQQPIQQQAIPQVSPYGQSTRDLVSFDSPVVAPHHGYDSKNLSGLPANVAGLDLNQQPISAAAPFTDDRTIGQASTTL